LFLFLFLGLVDCKNNPKRARSLEHMCKLFLNIYLYAKASDKNEVYVPIKGQEGKRSRKFKTKLDWNEEDFSSACAELLDIFRVENTCTCVGKNITQQDFLNRKNSHLPTDKCYIKNYFRNSAGRKKYTHLTTIHLPILMKRYKELKLTHDHESLERHVRKSKRRIQNNMSLKGIRTQPTKVGEFILTDAAFGNRLEYLVHITNQVIKPTKTSKSSKEINFISPTADEVNFSI